MKFLKYPHPKASIMMLFILVYANSYSQFTQPYGYRDNSFYGTVNMGAGKIKLTSPSAYLEIGDSTASRKGLLFPRGNKDSVANPARGLVIFDIPSGKLQLFDGAVWVPVGASSASVMGTGTGGRLALWSSGNTLTNSQVWDNGAVVGIGGINTSGYKLKLNGQFYSTGLIRVGSMAHSGDDHKVMVDSIGNLYDAADAGLDTTVMTTNWHLNRQIDSLAIIINNLSAKAKDITYAELLTAITASTLIPGKAYRITDFKTVYNIYGTSTMDSGVTEPLLVMATSGTTLSPQAYSADHPHDIIYYDVADNSEFYGGRTYGLISFRHDVSEDLSAHFNWRVVRWRRWALVTGGIYFAFTSNYPSVSPTDYLDQLTFGSGCNRIRLGEHAYNITLGDYNFDITIGSYCGSPGSGIVSSASVYGINIGEHCATVQTTGSGYIGGIYIGSNSRYINIGPRTYNVSIGSGCYALELGNQNSDIAIPPNTWRRRIEKGYSNFDATVTVNSSKTIDLYNNQVFSLGNILFSNANYCGNIYVTSTNAAEDVEAINAQINSLSFHDYRIIPKGSLVLNFKDKTTATTSAKNLVLNDTYIIDGTKSQYIQLHKNFVDSVNSNSQQRKDYYLSYTNAIKTGGFDSSFDATVASTSPIVGLNGVALGTTDIKATLKALLYPAQPPTADLTITYGGITTNNLTLETMATGAALDVTLNWTGGRQSNTAALATINVDGVDQSFTPPPVSTNVTGTLARSLPRNAFKFYHSDVYASDGKVAYGNVTVNFLYKRYWGFAATNTPTDAQIMAGPKEFINDRLRGATSPYNPTGSQYFFIAFPQAYDPGNISQIWIGGLDQTASFTRTVRSFTNASGAVSNYIIYTSNSLQSGSISFEIK